MFSSSLLIYHVFFFFSISFLLSWGLGTNGNRKERERTQLTKRNREQEYIIWYLHFSRLYVDTHTHIYSFLHMLVNAFLNSHTEVNMISHCFFVKCISELCSYFKGNLIYILITHYLTESTWTHLCNEHI